MTKLQCDKTLQIMTFCKVIHLRHLSDTLADAEFNQFTLHFIKTCGRNLFLSLICGKFISANNRNPLSIDTQPLDTAISIIQTIIRSRKQIDMTSFKIKLQLLPKTIIGEIASFLSQKDYASLSNTNRSIYMGCNDPPTLQHLNLSKQTKYARFHLQKYIHIKHLEIRLTKFHLLSLPLDGTKILNNLDELTLNGNKNINIDLAHFQSQIAIDLSNVRYLNLKNFGERKSRSKWFSFDTFIKLLSLFPNIEYLTINNANPNIDDNVDKLDINSLLPNLKGIARLCGSWRLLNHIIHSRSSLLQSLIFQYRDGIEIPSNIMFNNLEELCIKLPTLEIINNILNKTPSMILKRINLLQSSQNINDKVNMKQLMADLLIKQSSLESIDIVECQYDFMDSILDGIEKGLYSLQNRKGRLIIKLQFGTKTDITPKSSDTLIKIHRIMTQLKSSKLDDYTLRFVCRGIVDQEWKSQSFFFAQRHNTDFLIRYHHQRWQIRISNLNCNICGDVDYLMSKYCRPYCS